MPEFQAPPGLTPFEVFFDASEPNPELPSGLVRFAGNIGFPAPTTNRPWVYSNFVQSLDGMVTFGGEHPEGKWVAQSRHDRWMMDLLRAHADAVLYGSRSLIEETLHGGIRGGPVFRITDPALLRLRHESLGRGKQKTIVVTGSGRLRVSDYRLFQSDEVTSWIVTTRKGKERLGDHGTTRVLVFDESQGERESVDLAALLRSLREEHGVRYLLCEGGPTLNGNLARGGCIDEKFLTIAPQEIGPLSPGPEPGSQLPNSSRDVRSSPRRLSTIEGPGFSIESARWYRWIGCRKAGDHEFNRYRYTPREPGWKPQDFAYRPPR
jgi:riboflavin biosynthesis pyrimidine reductase